ncbi:hypothetical protein Phi19:3_gp078 [Cellulophaga phage phi19:3]|uniref:Uncharacterized protein n=1 Tax=Cellulophaga phage phi19:3 TaxID=1327971 RepID=R9ZYX4_9CAUD|nr:hypothetical protein Phi19:3_gp078 [Cellulophaga phage phi19:3]AGO47482.1 hypothetical protein Phi19:3_gp078 [Cellulophaga phage phi19:3]
MREQEKLSVKHYFPKFGITKKNTKEGIRVELTTNVRFLREGIWRELVVNEDYIVPFKEGDCLVESIHGLIMRLMDRCELIKMYTKVDRDDLYVSETQVSEEERLNISLLSDRFNVFTL